MAEGLLAALEVDEARGAPHAEVRVVRLAGTVHAAAHDGDRDVVLLRVLRHLLDVLRQVDERLILHARARRATDDVHPLVLEAGDGAEAAVLDVAEDLPADRDLLALALEGEGEGDADGVADAARDE